MSSNETKGRHGGKIIVWTKEEDDIVKKHLKLLGDTRDAVDESFKELEPQGIRSWDGVKTRIHTLGMRGDLQGVCNTLRFLKLKEKRRIKKNVLLAEQAKNDPSKNGQLLQEVLESSKEVKQKKDKTKKVKPVKKIIVAGSTVVGHVAITGRFEITGKNLKIKVL